MDVQSKRNYAEAHALLIENTLKNGFPLLRFDPPLEQEFRKVFSSISTKQVRFTSFVGFLIYLLFGLADSWLPPDLASITFLLRYGLVAPVLFLLIGFSFSNTLFKYSVRFLFLGCAFVALSFLGVIALLPSPYDYLYFIGFLPLSIFIFSIVHLNFKQTSLLVWFVFTVQMLSCLFMNYHYVLTLWGISSSSITALIIFFLVVVNFMGMAFSYSMERESRKDFLKSYLLLSENMKLKRLSEKLRELSTTDPLTALSNRRHFENRFESEWRRAMRERKSLSLVLLDVDFFKNYNDGYGHQMGDVCLQKISKVLKSHAQRSGDVAARYGGEEFILLFPRIDLQQLTRLVERLRLSVEKLDIAHKFSQNEKQVVTVSIGAASCIPERHLDPVELLAAVDGMLYEAKRNGRNTVVVKRWDPKYQTI